MPPSWEQGSSTWPLPQLDDVGFWPQPKRYLQCQWQTICRRKIFDDQVMHGGRGQEELDTPTRLMSFVNSVLSPDQPNLQETYAPAMDSEIRTHTLHTTQQINTYTPYNYNNLIFYPVSGLHSPKFRVTLYPERSGYVWASLPDLFTGTHILSHWGEIGCLKPLIRETQPINVFGLCHVGSNVHTWDPIFHSMQTLAKK